MLAYGALQDYRGAIAMYTQGAEAAGLETPAAAPLLGNRAAARMMILQYQQAVEDCDAALKCDPSNSKVCIVHSKFAEQTVIGSTAVCIRLQ
jgi:tetratricopeptide (TPR) repeat protein